jgi:lipopolysaccharide transport system permease protein
LISIYLSKIFDIATLLAWQDIRQAYRRSAIGPFWLTIGMGVQILTIGLVFSLIFKTEMRDYLPFLATSIILWGFISTTINEGCMAFISADAIIKQLSVPHIQHVIRVLWRNSITAAHNALILPIVFLFFAVAPNWSIVAFVPGLLILLVNLSWTIWLLGILSARYRDMPPIIASLMTIAFYLTPIMWYPKLIANDSLAHLLLGLNPLYHWVQIVRMPILGQWPTLENWGLAFLSAGIGWLATLLANKKYKNMIAYWV